MAAVDDYFLVDHFDFDLVGSKELGIQSDLELLRRVLHLNSRLD